MFGETCSVIKLIQTWNRHSVIPLNPHNLNSLQACCSRVAPIYSAYLQINAVLHLSALQRSAQETIRLGILGNKQSRNKEKARRQYRKVKLELPLL